MAKVGDIPGNRRKTEEGSETWGSGGGGKKNFKDPTETETKQVESKGFTTGAKQTEIRVSEIKHPERQTIVPVEKSQIEIVPKTEVRLRAEKPKEISSSSPPLSSKPKDVIPLESSLPPLEDPSVILLSPASTRRSDSTMLKETETEETKEVVEETETHEEVTENISESLDIKQLTAVQKQMTKNKQMTSTTNSSLSSKHEDYADLVEEVKHIKEDKARCIVL